MQKRIPPPDGSKSPGSKAIKISFFNPIMFHGTNGVTTFVCIPCASVAPLRSAVKSTSGRRSRLGPLYDAFTEISPAPCR